MANKGTPQEPKTAQGDSRSKAEFMGIPLAGWAVFAVSVITVLYTAGHFGFKLYDEVTKLRAEKATTLKDKEAAEAKAKQASAVNDDTSAYTNAITKEMDFHKKDGSGHHVTIHKDKKGEVFATFFDSDGCVAIGRPGSPTPYQPYPQAILEWSLGPGKRPASAPPPMMGSTLASSGADGSPEVSVRRDVGKQPEPAQREYSTDQGHILRVQAGCWNNGPHPWPFSSSWGRANGCWAPFYRHWNDGCTHYQMYNACNGQWDPRIYWTHCNPQHHP